MNTNETIVQRGIEQYQLDWSVVMPCDGRPMSYPVHLSYLPPRPPALQLYKDSYSIFSIINHITSNITEEYTATVL